MTFSYMRKPLPPSLVLNHYDIVLGKIQSGELMLRRRTVLNTVMTHRHVFRGGTSIDDKGDMHSLISYTNNTPITHVSHVRVYSLL